MPLVEALIVRVPAWLAAQMPFAVQGGRVSECRQGFGQSHLPLGESVRRTAEGYAMSPGADREAAGQDGRAARRTLCLHVHIRETKTFTREAVYAGRRRSAGR